MNVLQYAAIAQANWEHNAKNSWNSYEPNSTWASDLAIAMWFEKTENGSIEKTIKDAINNWNSEDGHRMLIMLGCAINYMSWYTYEDDNFKEYSKTFSDWYYKYLDLMDKIDENISSKIRFYLD